MDFKGLLNQLIASGADLTQQAKTAREHDSQGGLSDMTKGALGGAAAGSLLTLLVGSKKGRKMGKKAAKLGGSAALGALAYKVFNDWQSNGQVQAQSASLPLAQAMPVASEQHSINVLRALIAAAKSDGHVDSEEKNRISQAVESLGATAEVNAFVQQELDKPLNPADIARDVVGQEQAAEIYLASLVMVDEQNFMEQAYLKELANQLQLQPELVSRLEAQLA